MDLSLHCSSLYIANTSYKHTLWGDIAPYRLKFTEQRSALDVHLFFKNRKVPESVKKKKKIDEETLHMMIHAYE